MTTGINLALLPPLDVIQQLELTTIVDDIVSRAGLENASPSDPAYRVALASAYRELMLRQDSNEQARGLMLAFATGPELDHLGVTYYHHPDGLPVTRLVGELDDDYRARLQQAPKGLSVAGPDDAYIFHAKSASVSVKSAKVLSPAPVTVDLYILSKDGDGTPSATLLTTVEDYLQSRRPLTDLLTVKAAQIVNFGLTASLTLKASPVPETVRLLAEQSLQTYLDDTHQLNGRVVESRVHAALTVEGVEEVTLTGWDDVICTVQQAPYCNALSVTIGGTI